MKKFFALVFALVIAFGASAQKKEVVVLSLNDIHAAIEQFPQLADVVDSLRGVYPQLMVVSAGDNRTGNPYNDRYKEPSLPMTVLMNLIGVNASALGNHEWDNKVDGLRRQIQRSNFRYLCANMKPEEELGLHIPAYQFFDVEGVKVGVLGVTQLGALGIPDCHPDNVKGVEFMDVNATIKEYEWMRKECDVMLLLSHNGYEADIESANLYPWIDAILGGHSHTAVPANKFQNGVLIVQNKNKLRTGGTLVKITVEDGKVTKKESELIDVAHHKGKSEVVQATLDFLCQNEELERVVATIEQNLRHTEELGCLMAEAIKEEAGVDIVLQNGGGVRFGDFNAGPMTVADVLKLDPFGNLCHVSEMTGKQVVEFIRTCRDKDEQQIPYVAGIKYEITLDPADWEHTKEIKVMNPDGSKFNLKKKYKVATSNYIDAILDCFNGESIGKTTSDLILQYLEKKGSVDFKGRRCVKVIKLDNK